MVQRVQQMLHESRVSKFTFVLSLRSSKYALACKRVFADERVPQKTRDEQFAQFLFACFGGETSMRRAIENDPETYGVYTF